MQFYKSSWAARIDVYQQIHSGYPTRVKDRVKKGLPPEKDLSIMIKKMSGNAFYHPDLKKKNEPVSVMGPVGFEPTTKRL